MSFLWGRRTGRVFIIQIASFSIEGDGLERVHVIDYLTGVDQKIPVWLIMFSERG